MDLPQSCDGCGSPPSAALGCHSPVSSNSLVRAAGEPPCVGICCSGGGLRSAAFSFGAMDELWRAGILQEADYLAGVSGGSHAVTAATIVRSQSTDVEWTKDQPGPLAWCSPELDYLRNRTNYLAPGTMGRWNMFLRLLLGIMLNLAVVLGILYVIGRLGGRLYRSMLPQLGTCNGRQCTGTLAFHSWSVVLIVILLGAGLLAGILDLLFRPAADWWWRRLVRWCGTFVFLAIVAAIVLRLIPQLIWWARTSRFGHSGSDSDAHCHVASAPSRRRLVHSPCRSPISCSAPAPADEAA